MSFSDIDKKLLIALVKERPVLWDKSANIYKDRNATRRAWDGVCLGIREDFKRMGDSEKILFANEVLKVWRNIRDAYARSNRKITEDKTSGTGALPNKKYVYSEQLMFLSKADCKRELEDNIDAEKSPEENSDLPSTEDESSVVETNEPEAATFKKSSPRMGSKRRRSREAGHIEKRMLAALESHRQNRHMSFFKGVVPSLETFDDDEILEFQMGVLQIIKNIKRRKKMKLSHSDPMSTIQG